MNQQNNPFPLFFTLERVENGYVLTAKENTGSLTHEATYHKEVVTDDKINSRIGQLLHLDALAKEYPVVFHVEAIGETTYKTDESVEPDRVMEAKLAYVHFKSKNLMGDTVLVLYVEDTKFFEIYGSTAEKVAQNNNVMVSRVGGIPLLRFPDNKDGKKLLSSFCPRNTLVSMKQSDILKWYDEHPVRTSDK